MDAGPAEARPPLIDWGRTAARLRRLVLAVGVGVLVTWLVTGALGAGFGLGVLAELTGLGLLAVIAGEVVVVGGSALRGMLTAGDRGERLASEDVSLFPPQLTRRRRR